MLQLVAIKLRIQIPEYTQPFAECETMEVLDVTGQNEGLKSHTESSLL